MLDMILGYLITMQVIGGFAAILLFLRGYKAGAIYAIALPWVQCFIGSSFVIVYWFLMDVVDKLF